VDELADIAARYGRATQAAWVWDTERRRIIWANGVALTFFGAESLFDVVERAFAADSPEVRAALRAGEGIEVTLAPMGLPLQAVVDVSTLHLAHAKFARLVVMTHLMPPAQDATLARRAALFEYAPVALALCDLDGNVIEANAASAILCGGQIEHLAALVGGPKADVLIQLALAQGHATTGAERDGRRLRASALRVADSVSGYAAILIRIEDVTARRDLELLMRTAQEQAAPEPGVAQPVGGEHLWEALIAAEGARDEALRKSATKSEFIGKLSHEMRNPLNAIIGFAEIMREGHFGPLPDRYQGYAADIHTAAEHLLSLTEDLLDAARVEAGAMRVTPELLALGPIVEECARILRPTAAQADVALMVGADALPPVTADPRSVRQILINLISNALKFTPAGGVVRITAGMEGDGVAVTVADTGIGMNEAELKLALEPFGQVEGEHQKGKKGAGLGLPLVKALAEANGAAFVIASVKGEGTTVRVVFRSAADPDAGEAADAGEWDDGWGGACRLGPGAR
jgi:two-component system cell cycle sensor histidine kinase PleC